MAGGICLRADSPNSNESGLAQSQGPARAVIQLIIRVTLKHILPPVFLLTHTEYILCINQHHINYIDCGNQLYRLCINMVIYVDIINFLELALNVNKFNLIR